MQDQVQRRGLIGLQSRHGFAYCKIGDDIRDHHEQSGDDAGGDLHAAVQEFDQPVRHQVPQRLRMGLEQCGKVRQVQAQGDLLMGSVVDPDQRRQKPACKKDRDRS